MSKELSEKIYIFDGKPAVRIKVISIFDEKETELGIPFLNGSYRYCSIEGDKYLKTCYNIGEGAGNCEHNLCGIQFTNGEKVKKGYSYCSYPEMIKKVTGFKLI